MESNEKGRQSQPKEKFSPHFKCRKMKAVSLFNSYAQISNLRRVDEITIHRQKEIDLKKTILTF